MASPFVWCFIVVTILSTTNIEGESRSVGLKNPSLGISNIGGGGGVIGPSSSSGVTETKQNWCEDVIDGYAIF